METHSVAVSVSEATQVGQVRRLAAGLASRLGMSETEVGNVAIVATELANNMVHHGGGGRVLLRPVETPETGIEILALDKGPGMRSVDRCLEDGFSTAGTAGTGLGAVQRLSSEFDVYSERGSGTVVLARLLSGRSAAKDAPLQVGVVSTPKAGEDACGDAWVVLEARGRSVVAVADGLGHGGSAAIAGQAAMRSVRENARCSPAEMLELAHAALRGTRGAALAVAVLDADRREARFAGVGNIAALLVAPDGRARNMVSHNGTVGHQIRKVQEFDYPWPPGTTLLMHTDGLGTQWRLDPYPGLLPRHPGVIAGVLYRDFERGRDDATVLVVRETPASE